MTDLVRAGAAVAVSGGESLLEVRGVSKAFGPTEALVEVDFDVRAGEIHALVGQNGSGKSTLVKILAGVHDPDGGSIALEGEEFDPRRPGEARLRGLRFVHQDLGLVDSLDVVENLALGRGYDVRFPRRISWRHERSQAHAALADLGYELDVRSLVGSLRASERTGIAIARALDGWESAARLLVLDEPTASLPEAETARLFDVVRTIRARGVGVIYVSHHLDEVLALADRVTILRDGARVGTFDAEDLDHDRMVELIVGRGSVTAGGDGALPPGPTEHEPSLVAQNLSGAVLRGVSLRVGAGEVVGVAGLTGSGREEIGPALFGAAGRSGSVAVAGRVVPAERPDLAIAAGLGFVPADRKSLGLVASMVVRENVTLADLRPYRRGGMLRHRKERSDVDAWLAMLAVRPRDQTLGAMRLSGGNQQKVLLARWLRIQPRVLVLDEPTQGVDVGAKAEIHRRIVAAARDGTGVLVCSTDSAELVRVCDRVLIMQRGEIGAELLGRDISEERIDRLCLS